METFQYSRWDNTQHPFRIDPDDLLNELADDLMKHGDLKAALRSVMRRGMRGQMGSGFEGIREMIQRLKQQKQQRLERYDLNSIFNDLNRRLEQILRQERATLRKQAKDGRAGKSQKKEASRKLKSLDRLPQSFAGRIQGLQDYSFADAEAGKAFQELMDSLKQQALGSYFKELAQRLREMTPEEIQQLKQMLADLNDLMDRKIWGERPDFEGFMRKHGHLFGAHPPQSLEELIQRLQEQSARLSALFQSLPTDLRDALEEMLEAAWMDPEMAAELAELAANLDFLHPAERKGYPFSGQDPLPLEKAMALMDELQKIDTLQDQIEALGKKGRLEEVDEKLLEEILGPEGKRELEKLKALEKELEEAGYLRRQGNRLELTPKAIRKIGLKALLNIFDRLKASRQGGHRTDRRGLGVEATHETKAYEFGDPLRLHLQQTLMRSVHRGGPGTPIQIRPEDFEVYREDQLTQCSTVLMLDQSHSMGLNGYFEAAKRVTLALHSLIQTQYPRDHLYVIGFSDLAREIRCEEIPETTWNTYTQGTNMHHALMIARKLLSRSRSGQRQIIMITDGEPTAHLEHGQSFFNYPPSHRTLQQTLLEVKRCTQEEIVINTFMLEQDPRLMKFIHEVTKINRGRAFFSSPSHLGEYIVTDYITHRRRRIA
ncbi:MAG: VWA domain-containing protein [Candidatus Tectomicrobia bacterium]|uniref:VWA domain-containing protein n=1 Tax=Tectimicrobiota bacterium TaxID=2528274 RepID=A0A932CQZ9_UNCTE|nr:VWA domain-containing protein [Candidatus Tectomicrobia bacterium]